MTDPVVPPPDLHPSIASSRSWWFGGDFLGVRYRAALQILVLDAEPSDPVPQLPPGADRAATNSSAGRTEVEVWEWEGGAVVGPTD